VRTIVLDGYDARSDTFHPKNNTVVIGCSDGMIRWFDASSIDPQIEIFNKDTSTDKVLNVKFSSDGQRLITSNHCNIRSWNVTTKEMQFSINTSTDSLSISKDGSRIMSSIGCQIFVWNAYDGQLLHKFTTKCALNHITTFYADDTQNYFNKYNA